MTRERAESYVEELLAEINRLLPQDKNLNKLEFSDKCKIEIYYSGGDPCIEFINKYLNSTWEEMMKLEEEIYRKCGAPVRNLVIYGYYVCTERKITIFLGCYRREKLRSLNGALVRYLETLSHELIHHLQYTRASLTFSNGETFEAIVRYEGCDDPLAREVDLKIPYRFRPHEAEAFERAGALARLLSRTHVRSLLHRILEEYKDVLGV